MSRLILKSFKPVVILCLAATLGACTSAPEQAEKSVDEIILDAVRDQPDTPLTAEQDQMSAEDYIALASESSGKQREQFLLKAAELLYQRGDLDMAQSQLQTLDAESSAQSRQHQISLLAAKIALANENPRQAIELLPAPRELPLAQYIEARKVSADANLELGYHLAAVRTRVDLERYLETEEARENNHQAIWAALQRTPELSLKPSNVDNKTTRGWISLASALRNTQSDMRIIQERILDWATRYPDHPVSNVFIDRLLAEYQQSFAPANNIAIMLPMKGKYKSVADAIQSGIVTAWYEQTTTEKPLLRFYDTSNENLSFYELYQQAILDGASHIIGPLDKVSINKLAQESNLDVPILTLNYSKNPLSLADNLYQFGLLPEDEARQVAELAIRENHTTAAVLVPNSSWGRRLQDAFSERFEELGGSVLTVQHYPTNVDDYSKQLQALFNLDDSHARHKDLEHILATRLKFMPYRRQDVDMIFLAGTHRAARGIIPALKFHHAGGLPVYATSHVYSGNRDLNADRDLNGVTFCDLPWTLASSNKYKQNFDSIWKDQRTYTRLFALGVDAYNLVQNLKYLQTHDYARYSGETGSISMDKNRRLHRELLWAKFKNGQPVYLDLSIPPATTVNHGPKQS
ncbi:MAG: penicillin-binding protein activator [Gammaproteobacteria bacterium]|nr:penicillin-binding protein activator [Gammaproteobacteria bacterium]